MSDDLSWQTHIGDTHADGSDHEPDWTTVAHADVPPDRPIFDVWCRICGQSGSFSIHPMDEVNWT